jgi:hypothetical protein
MTRCAATLCSNTFDRSRMPLAHPPEHQPCISRRIAVDPLRAPRAVQGFRFHGELIHTAQPRWSAIGNTLDRVKDQLSDMGLPPDALSPERLTRGL